MAHLTGNFTSEAPLSQGVREAILAAFDQGWADPKLSQAAGRAAILADSAKEEISSALHIAPGELEILGEPSLAHYIAIYGYLRERSTFISSTIDLGKIRALRRNINNEVREVGVDHHGLLIRSGLKLSSHTLFSLQAVNGETGTSQDLEHWRGSAGEIVVDATRALPGPDFLTGFSAATFDAQSWSGPSGIGFIAIRDAKNFKYPLPHIAPIRVPGGYSLPLLIGSAIAIKESLQVRAKVVELRNLLARELSEINGLTIVGQEVVNDSRHVSAVVDEISAEELLRDLLTHEIQLDAGSACSPEDLAPSHVIASMGYPTSGHIRLSVHANQNDEDIYALVGILRESLSSLRR